MSPFLVKERRASQAAILIAAGTLLALAWLNSILTGHVTGCVLIMQLVFITAAPYLGALPFGHEFDHGTLSLSLLEPKVRMRIWGEKMLVALLLLSLFTGLNLKLVQGAGVAASHMELWLPISWALHSLCAGPWLVLVCRSTLAAAACSFLGSLCLLVAFAFAVNFQLISAESEVWVWISLSYSTLIALAGARAWSRYELRPSSRKWFRDRSVGFDLRLLKAPMRRTQPLLNAWRREWMLQQGNACFASMFVLLTVSVVTEIRLVSSRGFWDTPHAMPHMDLYELGLSILPVLLVVAGMIIPLLVGAACGADRAMNTSFLVLSQPSPWRTQMSVRLGLSGLVALGLGSLPAYLGFWETRGYSGLHWVLYGTLSTPLLICSGGLIAFGIGWLSSQVARSPLKGVILGCSLCMIVLLSWLVIHQWVGPQLVQWVRPRAVDLTWWDIAELFHAAERNWALGLLFGLSTLGYALILARRAFQQSCYLFVQQRSMVIFFAATTLGFLLLQFLFSVIFCLTQV